MNTLAKVAISLVATVVTGAAACHFLKNGGIDEMKDLVGRNKKHDDDCDCTNCDINHEGHDAEKELGDVANGFDIEHDLRAEASESM